MRFDREMDSKVDSKPAWEFRFPAGVLAVPFTVHSTAVTNISQWKFVRTTSVICRAGYRKISFLPSTRFCLRW